MADAHTTHCYQGENPCNCKYGDEDCSQKIIYDESQNKKFNSLEFLQLLNRPIGQCNQDELEEVSAFLDWGLERNKPTSKVESKSVEGKK